MSSTTDEAPGQFKKIKILEFSFKKKNFSLDSFIVKYY